MSYRVVPSSIIVHADTRDNLPSDLNRRLDFDDIVPTHILRVRIDYPTALVLYLVCA